MTNGTQWHIIECEYLNGEIRLQPTTHNMISNLLRSIDCWIINGYKLIDWYKKQWPIDRRG